MKIVESQGDVDYNGLVVADQLESALQLLEQRETEFAEYLSELNRRNDEITELRNQLYEVMAEKGIKKLQGNKVTFSLVAPSKTVGLDIKLMQTTNPGLFAELHNQYAKDTDRKGYVRISNNTDKTKGKYIQ